MNGPCFNISLCSYTACMLVRISKSPLIKAFSYLVHNLATPLIPLLLLTLRLNEGGLQILSLRLIPGVANWAAGYWQVVIGGHVVRPAVQRADVKEQRCDGRTAVSLWGVCSTFITATKEVTCSHPVCWFVCWSVGKQGAWMENVSTELRDFYFFYNFINFSGNNRWIGCI